MLKEERLELICSLVGQHKYASYEDLTGALGASKATVRRDLELLAEQGRLDLVRGGAVARQDSVRSELPYEQKRRYMRDEKRRIAQAAAQMVAPGDCIFLESGTTVREMVPFLAGKQMLHVITGDIAIAGDLTCYPHIKVTVLGGELRSGYFNLNGFFAEQFLDSLKVDICFCAVDAITKDGGCMINELSQEVALKQKCLQAGKKAVLLCDHGKVGKEALIRLYDVSAFHKVIMGKELQKEYLETFANAELMLV
ncbi:MAG: DeoR/GlpR transcriptional regulator [Christensenellaceae bacterium]|nr:DeoR/GlpR transcriptional regulator [Christensenellaceae bacterium]